ncbi:MAG: Crp/Fnr family transcriptional regulator [Cyclobacteriaceae bacterium]
MSIAFKTLTPAQLALVDQHRSELSYRKGEIMCKEGAFLSNMLFVKKGLVKIFIEKQGNPTIISIERNGHFVGLPSVFNEGDLVYHYTVEALTDTEVCLVDIGTFMKLVEENQAFANQVMHMLSSEVIRGYQHMLSLTQKQIRGRFAELILHLKNSIYEQSEFELTITRKDMSDLIATTQESISRLIKEFKKDRLIELNHQRMLILDEAKLHYLSRVG